MEYRLLGRTGVKVSPFCLGAMNFGGPTPQSDAIRIIHRALDASINFIDTANIYQDGESERAVGKALAGERRKKVILATKVHFPTSDDPNDRGNTRRHILMAVEESLGRLDTDWIDLYQIHRPVFDFPQDETLRAMDDLIRQGKVRYIGTSTYPAWFIMEALALSERYGLVRFVSEQPPYNLLDRRIENELIPFAQRHNVALITWSPLAMGMLAGRYSKAGEYPKGSRGAGGQQTYTQRITQGGIDAAAQVAKVAEAQALTPSQLALMWVKDRPGVTAPILGVRTEAHLEDALAILDKRLEPEVLARLDEIVPPGSAVANFFNNSGWMPG